VQVVSGGFPCQDISAAGKGAGIDGERSGMWREMARIICEVRPRFVFVENSPMLTSRGLGVVLGDLAKMGFDAKWGVLGAADVGAPHQRDRIWIAGWRDIFPHTELHRLGWREQQSEGAKETTGNVADTSYEWVRSCVRGNGWEFDNQDSGWDDKQGRSGGNVEPSETRESSDLEKEISDSASIGLSRQGKLEQSGNSTQDGDWKASQSVNVCKRGFWEAEPDVGRVADGVASRVDRLKAIGNGQVPLVAATAWEELSK
jgi:DNA (cytosine-5)-methyltransferase 1